MTDTPQNPEADPEERRRIEAKALEGVRALQEGRAGRAGRPRGSGMARRDMTPQPLHPPILEALARAGYDDREIAALHNMVPSQFSRLLVLHPELSDAIAMGRSEIADLLSGELWRAAIERHEWQALKKLLKRYKI